MARETKNPLNSDSHKYFAVGATNAKKFALDDEDESVEISLQNDYATDNEVVEIDWRGPAKNSILSSITFGWIVPLLELGNQRPLEQTDLYPLEYKNSAAGIFEEFKSAWQNELSTKRPSVVLAFLSSFFSAPFFSAGLIKLVHDSCLFISPMMLKRLISFLEDPSEPLTIGLFYVFIIFFANFLMSLCLRQYFYWCYLVGMRLRAAVVTSVYDKSLRLSTSGFSSRTSGEIMNLLSVDASRLQELTPYLHAIWYSFYQIGIAMYLLWFQLSYAALAGALVIIILIPVTTRVSGYSKDIQKALSKLRDERVKVTNEVLGGMKVIKFQAWEKEFEQRISSIREQELITFRKYVVLQSLSSAFYTSTPLLVAISSFTVYVMVLGNDLTIAKALTALALFDILRFPLFMLPNVLNSVIEAKVSLDRVQTFLLERDFDPIPSDLQVAGFRMGKDNQKYKELSTYCENTSYFVCLNKASAVWEASYAAEKKKHGVKPPAQLEIGYSPAPEDAGAVTLSLYYLNHYATLLYSKVKNYAVTSLRKAYGSRYTTPDSDLLFETADDEEASFLANEYSLKNQLRLQSVLLEEAEGQVDKLESQLTTQRSAANEKRYESNWLSSPNIKTSTLMDSNFSEYSESKIEDIKPALQMEKKKETRESGLTLSRVSLRVSPGEIVAVVGQVGSGKSSVLRSLIGDLRVCYGDIILRGKCCYLGQKPFIQNATLRENILFGEPFNEERYLKTCEMCALIPDFSVLPAGDLTEIGEKGINLSGGQKTRVALARCVYSGAKIYLLDDPLAAVDAHVGQHLFNNCIQEIKRNGGCVVLVTNALQYTRTCNHIVVMKDGRIAESGPFSAVMSMGGVFSSMMNAYLESHGEEVNQDVAVDAASGVDASLVVGESKIVPISIKKVTMSDLHSDKKTGNLMTKEDREVGNVDRQVYLQYLKSLGGARLVSFLLSIYLLAECINVSASWWLSYWSEHAQSGSVGFYLTIYIFINVGVAMAMLYREVQMRLSCLEASRSLYNNLLLTILYAPMSFFDTTPLGRIINRFSKDIYTVDEQLPGTIRMYIGSLTKVGGVLLYICVVTPFFVICLFPIAAFYYVSQKYYISTSRELSRLENVSRSPIYALFSETIDGMSTIRAYHAEQRFRERNNELLNNNLQAYYLNFSANCWLAVRLELAGTLIVTFTALTAVLSRNNVKTDSSVSGNSLVAFAGMAGLAISLSLQITQSLNWSVRMASDLESQMVSVERIGTYCKEVAQEAAYEKPTDPDLDTSARLTTHYLADISPVLRGGVHPYDEDSGVELTGVWPSKGTIEFRNVCLRYRPGLPLVLNNCNFLVNGGEKVGIVGRTGAGKSSLVTALLRLVELEDGSHIYVDDVDVSTLGLKCLRSHCTVIPQDPVLFSGTVRNNLDPFGRYTDEQIWHSLKCISPGRKSQQSAEGHFIKSLSDVVEENGSNFSVGQRQLLCIARALLSRSKIIIMDEATAAVDVETDAAIQNTFRTDFASATCLIIAHRLNTIMDCDRILVMDQGRVAEFDSPNNLLARPTSIFSDLVRNWEDSNN